MSDTGWRGNVLVAAAGGLRPGTPASPPPPPPPPPSCT